MSQVRTKAAFRSTPFVTQHSNDGKKVTGDKKTYHSSNMRLSSYPRTYLVITNVLSAKCNRTILLVASCGLETRYSHYEKRQRGRGAAQAKRTPCSICSLYYCSNTWLFMPMCGSLGLFVHCIVRESPRFQSVEVTSMYKAGIGSGLVSTKWPLKRVFQFHVSINVLYTNRRAMSSS